jgi:hypothetical protein
MKNYNYKFLGKFSMLNQLKNILNDISDSDWEEYTFRQKNFSNHIYTRTIPIIFNEDFRSQSPTRTKWYPLFGECLKELNIVCNKKYGNGFFVRSFLVKLLPKTKIPKHIDSGGGLELCNRVHIPIITNEKIKFFVDNQRKYLREGEIWEVNNTRKEHSVSNDSDIDRIHLICDFATFV